MKRGRSASAGRPFLNFLSYFYDGFDYRLGIYVDNVLGALLRAKTAVLALVRIDDSVVVDHVDGVELAFLLAELASYTSCGAYLVGILALVGGIARDIYALDIRNDIYDLLRADACAHSAADAYIPVDLCQAVAYFYGAVGACPLAVAETYASELAAAGASEEALYSGAGLKALIVHLGLGGVAQTGAAHVGDLLYHVQGFLTEYARYRSSNAVGAGDAEVALYAFRVSGQGGGIVVTARISAGTAVGAGELISDSHGCLVYRNCHELGGQRQKSGSYECYHYRKNYRS